MELFLGNQVVEGQDEPEAVVIPGATLLRHAVCLGASGSGKTVACKVLCEEFLLAGVPVIALDPQGDIASMILPGDPEDLEQRGLDGQIAAEFHQRIEVVIWTPGSYAGVPLCLDPLQLKGLPKRKSDRVRVLSAIAANLTALLGYSLDSNDGQFAAAYLDLALQYLAENQQSVGDLSGFAAFLDDMPEGLKEEAGRVIKDSKREELGRKIQVLGIGAKKLLFQMGAPVNIDMLLGSDEGEDAPTRLSVIYLNTLHSQEEKEFFVSQICQRLYDWMLNNPADVPQALFYIDEIAPFMPPVRKPACKDVLKMVFKQARKYGVSCLIASQNPGDIDYTALAQFSTWALGRMMIRQDIKKVEQMIRSLSPGEVDETVEKLPSLEPGHFLLISPDLYDRVVPMQVRWLYTRHETLDEDRVEDLIDDDMRERFARVEHEEIDEPEAEATPEPEAEVEAEVEPEAEVDAPRASAPRGSLKLEDAGLDEPEEDKPQTHKELILSYLDEHPGAYSVKELTHEVALSETPMRKHLKELVSDKLVSTAKVGRSHFYWLNGHRFEPSVGIVRPIQTISFRTDPEEARRLAEKECQGSLFGLLKKETVEGPKESYLLMWQVVVAYEKTSGMLFKSKEHKEVTLYFDAKTGRLLIADGRNALHLVESTDLGLDALLDPAEGLALTPHTPAELGIQTRSLQACKTPEKSVERCRKLFGLECRYPRLVGLPYWKFTLRSSDGKSRNVHVDGLYGRVFEIPTRAVV